MFKNLKKIELLECHLEKLQRAMIGTTPINGNAHQVYFEINKTLWDYTPIEREEQFVSTRALNLKSVS